MNDRHDPAEHWIDRENRLRRAPIDAVRRARNAATGRAVLRGRVKSALASAEIVKPVTTDPNQDTAMPDVLAAARQRLARRRRPDPTVRENVSGATAAHSAFQLPAGICAFCGVECDTATTLVAVPGFARHVQGSVCPGCAAADPPPHDDAVAFVIAEVKAAYPDASELPGHLARAISLGGPPGPIGGASWAGHVQTLFGRGRPEAPAANTTPWGHLAEPAR